MEDQPSEIETLTALVEEMRNELYELQSRVTQLEGYAKGIPEWMR